MVASHMWVIQVQDPDEKSVGIKLFHGDYGQTVQNIIPGLSLHIWLKRLTWTSTTPFPPTYSVWCCKIANMSKTRCLYYTIWLWRINLACVTENWMEKTEQAILFQMTLARYSIRQQAWLGEWDPPFHFLHWGRDSFGCSGRWSGCRWIKEIPVCWIC